MNRSACSLCMYSSIRKLWEANLQTCLLNTWNNSHFPFKLATGSQVSNLLLQYLLVPLISVLTLMHFSRPPLLAFQMFIAASVVCSSLSREKYVQTAGTPGWLALYLLCTSWTQTDIWSSGEQQVRFITSNKSLDQNQYAACKSRDFEEQSPFLQLTPNLFHIRRCLDIQC